MNKLIYIMLSVFLFAACEKEEPVMKEQEKNPVAVKLNIRQHLAGLRASNAMSPEKENFIYDIWLLQYNSLGKLVSADGVDKRQHLRVGEDGVEEVNDLEVTLLASDNSTVCLIANLGDNPLDDNALWPEDLETFKKLTIPIDFVSAEPNDDMDGHVNKIGLFGYYTGAVDNGTAINISLSRLITRIKLNIELSYEMTGTVELKLENVRSRISIFPTEIPYQPQGTTEDEKNVDKSANFTSFTKTLPNLDTDGIVQYFM